MPRIASGPVRIIAGSGRSGTTWLLDTLAAANALRPVFEPLHPEAVPEARPYAYRYFRPGSVQVLAEDFLARAFDGRFHNWWTDYRVRPDRLRPTVTELGSIAATHRYLRRWRKLYQQYRRYAPATRRPRTLVKLIRANLMLGWLRARFDARIVFVLRHPCAVVESRLRLGGDDWEPHAQLAHYLDQPDLQEDYLFKYTDLLQRSLTAAEAHTAIWCIENQFPLAQLPSSGATAVFYEDLLRGAAASWRAVLDALGLEQMPDAALLSIPSQSAAERGGTGPDAGHIGRWRERLDAATLRQIEGMLGAMDVSAYRIDDPMPRISPLAAGTNVAQMSG